MLTETLRESHAPPAMGKRALPIDPLPIVPPGLLYVFLYMSLLSMLLQVKATCKQMDAT